MKEYSLDDWNMKMREAAAELKKANKKVAQIDVKMKADAQRLEDEMKKVDAAIDRSIKRRRNGSTLRCGCWVDDVPLGSGVGITHTCQVHGSSIVIKNNVDEPLHTGGPIPVGTVVGINSDGTVDVATSGTVQSGVPYQSSASFRPAQEHSGPDRVTVEYDGEGISGHGTKIFINGVRLKNISDINISQGVGMMNEVTITLQGVMLEARQPPSKGIDVGVMEEVEEEPPRPIKPIQRKRKKIRHND